MDHISSSLQRLYRYHKVAFYHPGELSRLRCRALHRKNPLLLLEKHISTIGLALVLDKFTNIVGRYGKETVAKDAGKPE